MTFREGLLKRVAKIRQIPGPTHLDSYRYRTILRTRAWSGNEVDLGTSTDTDVTINPRPRLKEISDTEYLLGPITPAFPGGGFTPEQLSGYSTAGGGTEVLYSVTGPDGTERLFVPISVDTSKAYSYFVRLRSLDRKTPY